MCLSVDIVIEHNQKSQDQYRECSHADRRVCQDVAGVSQIVLSMAYKASTLFGVLDVNTHGPTQVIPRPPKVIAVVGRKKVQ